MTRQGWLGELWVAWLLPCGRAALRFASALALAVVLTLRIPSVSSLSAWDVVLASYAAALAEAGVTQVWQHGSALTWIRDVFNALDVTMLLLLLGLAGCTISDVLDDGRSEPSPRGVALQAFATLVAWVRLLEISYAFPTAGPQLLTVLYLLSDLIQVST